MNNFLKEQDDSVSKPLDKSDYDDNPTEQININKIQLPGGIIHNEEDVANSLFSKPPSFNYEKDAIQKANIKFNELDPTGTNSNSQNDQCIIDKYKDQLNKEPEVLDEEAKEVRKTLRRQQTLQKRKQEKELKEIELEIDEHGEKIDKLASIVRLAGLVTVTILSGVCIFFFIRKYGNNAFLLWIGLEIVNDGYLIILGFITIKIINSREIDINRVLRLRIWIYISCAFQAIMIILGFALIKYSKGFSMSGDRKKNSDGLYNILGIIFIVLCFLKGGVMIYWVYLYRKYLPLHEKYYKKSNVDFTMQIEKKAGSDSPSNAV